MEEKSKQQELSSEQEKILKLLKDRPAHLLVLAEALDKSQEATAQLIDSLIDKGYEISYRTITQAGGRKIYEVSLSREPIEKEPIRLDFTRKQFKFLVISDPGIGLKTHQPHLIATAIEIGKKEKVDFALCAGDIVGGKSTATDRGDYLNDDFNEQVDYVVKNWPEAPFKTYFINGPRDLRHKKKGQNVAKTIGEQREDFRYEGDLEANFFINRVKNDKDKKTDDNDRRLLKIKLMHIKDEVTYTKSYTLQGLAENFQEAITHVYRKARKPDLLLVGGVYSHLLYPTKKKNGMQAIGLPSLYAMTPIQKSRKKRGGAPQLGCVIVTVKLDKDGKPKEISHEFYDFTAYQVYSNYTDSTASDMNLNSVPLTEETKTVLTMLRERPCRYGELSRELGRSKEHIKKIVENLRYLGYEIFFDQSSKKLNISYDWRSRKFQSIPLEELFVKKVKIASISDTHIGNKKARLDLIPKAYQIAEKEEADVITVSGDICDGIDAYRGQEMELDIHGADAQKKKAVEVWPKSKIPTKIIAGSSHEWVFYTKCGHNVVEAFAREMENVEYIGGEMGLTGTAVINGVTIKLVHPKGGIPYGKTYRMQQRIESLVEEMKQSVEGIRVLQVGHLHIAFFMLYKGIAAFLVPCLEEKTRYLKSKGLNPWLGMWIAEVTLDKYNNVTKVVPKYISFED